MKRVVDPGSELISAEWLRTNSDRIELHEFDGIPEIGITPSTSERAIFEIEQKDEGYTHLKVTVVDAANTCLDFELESGWMSDDGMQSTIVFLGMYSKLNDLKALLEVLARGLV